MIRTFIDRVQIDALKAQENIDLSVHDGCFKLFVPAESAREKLRDV